MNRTQMSALLWVVIALTFTANPMKMSAQCSGAAGQNAVYADCTTGATLGIQGSWAFIDASAYTSTGDLCARLHSIMSASGYPSNGAVIDARGVLPASGTVQPCATNPWSGSLSVPSTILLPAGTIQLSVQWPLPTGTRIIGQGSGAPGGGVTTLQALSGTFPSNLALIRMIGASATSVEDVALDGANVTGVNGITNTSSQELSYVKRVSMTNMVGTGLAVVSTAAQSGPYSDINFSTTSSSASTVCASIQAPTRGVHGLTCKGGGVAASTGVKLDAPNNSIEDVQISGFADGIALGKALAAPSNVLFNIKGGSGVTNVVHIASTTSTNVTIMNVAANGATTTIQDDVTSTTLSASANPTVGVYALGSAVSPGYSRFTTSPTAPSWVVGNSTPPTTGVSCPQGGLYSNTAGGSKTTWYVCESNKWVDID
jgi:hypothetical protein